MLINMKKAFATLGILCLVAFPHGAHAAAPTKNSGFKDYQVTASFIYKLIQHVDWPNGHKPQDKTMICVVSHNSFDAVPEVLTTIAKDARYTLPIEVKQNVDYTNTAELSKCHILYVGFFERSNVEKILAATKGLPILTVSKLRDFARHGGVVGLIVEDGQDTVLQINVASANQKKMVINARLLQMAEIYGAL